MEILPTPGPSRDVRWRTAGVDELKAVSATPWTLRNIEEPVTIEFGADKEKHDDAAEASPMVPRRLKITMTTLKEFG